MALRLGVVRQDVVDLCLVARIVALPAGNLRGRDRAAARAVGAGARE